MKENHKIKNLGYPLGYLLSAYAFIGYFSFPFLVWKLGIISILIGYFSRVSVLAIDYYTSNATKYNMSIIDKNGFDSKKILKSSFINFSKRFFILGVIYNYLLNGVESHYDLKLIINVVVMLTLTEIYFIIAHKIMHRYYPNVHKLHHCCLRPSLTTNLFFEKLDIFLEVTIPNIIIILYTTLITKDYFSLVVGFAFMSTWYPMDHDEYLKLPHWYHHCYINSNYGAYVKGGSFDERDEVKKVVIR